MRRVWVERVTSAVGMCAILGVAYLTCPRPLRPHLRLRPLVAGLGCLLATGVIVLRTPAASIFAVLSAGVERLIQFSQSGTAFLFGNLATPTGPWGFVFALQVLPTIVFFSALTSVLYFLKVIPVVVEHFGKFLSRITGASGAESFSTVADIFVGQTEAPLVIRSYLPRMSLSEINTCMVAGYASTAGGVLAAYVAMLAGYVPQIAGHLIAASVMSAPATLVVSKLMWPETAGRAPEAQRLAGGSEYANLLDAITQGTASGLRLAANVGAMLIVFVAFTHLANAALSGLGHWFGADLTLERLLGWLFVPLSYAMGVPTSDVSKVSTLLGQKTVLNEFIAYTHMAEMLREDPAWLTPRGRLIASYALCGFANFGSIGIQLAGYSALAPERRADFSRLALRAMFGGLLTTCLVACVAGILL
jgi:concentrative nucleoside transporter, CNT family